MASARSKDPTPARAPAPSTSGRRVPTQARSRRTVEAILEAAAEVFDEHGFEAGTTERIVARAGVSVGTLYQYFPNKEALVAALAEHYCRDFRALHDAWLRRLVDERPPVDAGLLGFVDLLVATHAARPRLRCLLFEARPLPPELATGFAALHAALTDGLTSWLTGRVPEPRVAAVLLQATVPTLIHRFVLHPHPELPPDRARIEVFRLARAYLAASERSG